MLYIKKGEVNNLVLNINNNARPEFTGYTLTFTHKMSSEVKSYTISTSDPNVYTSNIRYCTIVLDLTTDDLNYLGQYQLDIFGNGTDNVFIGLVILEEGTLESPFIQYISPNENNENYIYTT